MPLSDLRLVADLVGNGAADLGGWTVTKAKRVALRLLTYEAADKIIRESNGAWTIAPEEDGNRQIGLVYLERLVPGVRVGGRPMRPLPFFLVLAAVLIGCAVALALLGWRQLPFLGP